jgi:hypothetical protein
MVKVLKHRTESEELKLLRSLHIRMKLADQDFKNYMNMNLEKGFEGEKQYDIWLAENLSGHFKVLNDLLLEYRKNKFQIDSLITADKKFFNINVKNFEGDYYVDGDRWYTFSGLEIQNPLLQLQRSETLLRQLLHDFGYNITVESYCVFINPKFQLYQAPRNPQLIFPTQLERFIGKMNNHSSPLNERHTIIAEKLISLHIIESPNLRSPGYSYEKLEKGFFCGRCYSMGKYYFKERSVVCIKCGFVEGLESAILRCVEEILLLFPDQRITTKAVQEWCKIESEKTVRRILIKNLQYIGHGRSSYYIFP